MKKKLCLLAGFLAAFTALAFGWFVSDCYPADIEAIAAFQSETTRKPVLSDNTIVYAPEDAETGIIFYPGGKVEAAAYEPLMIALAEKNILTVLVEMPFNLAVFDMNAADGISDQYPSIEHWYIGGHSLGGVMASSYVSQHLDAYEGLILLASYATQDLSMTDLKVLSMYGTEDQVLNLKNYEENKVHLPKDLTEIILEGGNHAQFGMYGPQDGDGTATISNIEQIEQTAQWIASLCAEK